MGVTTHMALPFPGTGDDVDVPGDMQSLAETVDTKLWNTAWGEVGYAEIVADTSGFTTLADLGGLTVPVACVNGRKYKVTGHCQVTSTVAGDVITVHPRMGTSTVIGRVGITKIDAANASEMFDGRARITGLGTGTRTFKLSAERSGSGTCIVQASATNPAFILVEDIGPS
jgi:hypothetical protein